MSISSLVTSPCGEPESLRNNAKVLKLCKLTDEQLLHMDVAGPAKGPMPMQLRPEVTAKPPVPAGASLMMPLQESLLPLPVRHHTLVSAAEALKAANSKPSANNLNALLVHKASKEESLAETCYLAEALRNFDRSYSAGKHLVDCKRLISNSSAPNAISTMEARTISSSYISAHDDSDENYVEVSDVSESKSKESILNVLYEDTVLKKPNRIRKHASNSDLSNDSIMESGYKSYNSSTTTPRLSQESNQQMCEDGAPSTTSPSEGTQGGTSTSASKPCVTDVYPICRPYRTSSSSNGLQAADPLAACASIEESSEQISKLIVELIGPNSRLGKLLMQSCASGQDPDGIFDEIKQCVQAELQLEDKVTSFFKAPPSPDGSSPVRYDSLRNLDDSLNFVKDHLTQIHHDLNDFKENCWKKIESKVSHTEFSDTTAILRAKMTYLERKMFNEHRLMRQDLRNFREKLNHLENDSACSFKNFPIWPVVAFIGAYSIINLGHR